MSNKKPPGPGSTENLPGTGGVPSPPRPPGVTMVIYYCDGTETAQLTPGEPLVVGRGETADCCVPDGRLSREHARFTLVEGRVLVEDLGSKHGTSVAGKRVERAEIALGDEVMLGMVIVRVLTFGRIDPALDSDEAFRRQLDAELARAQLFGRPFAVLAVLSRHRKPVPGGSWAARLRERLRSVDRVSLYTPDMALVLLPEVASEVALWVAGEIAGGPAEPGETRFVGVAVYPQAASTTEKLVDLAREAAGRARPESPVATAPTDAWKVSDAHSGMIVSAALRKVLDMADKVASSQSSVYLHGETGTGKELLASYIHKQGVRRDKPLICVNCGAIPASLVESTLFGHERGAFTGALERNPGVFEKADKGTLFLDEIGDLPEAAQTALLRVLETRSFLRVGAAQEVKVDVRVIAATHHDLEAMVKGGTFREDLYYRLTVVLQVPPLRDQLDTFELLVEHFLADANKKQGRSVLRVAEDAMALLKAYVWPGNARELRSVIDAAVLFAPGSIIQPEDLPPRIREGKPRRGGIGEGGGDLKSQLARAEVQLVMDALQKTNWNITKAAVVFDQDRTSFRRRMKRLGIKKPKT